jgi:hypothetical protein
MIETLTRPAIGRSTRAVTSFNGVVYDSRYGSPQIMVVPMGYQPVDSTHSATLKFTLPSNVVMIQKVTLSIFLLPFYVGNQTASSATSAGASSSVTSTGGSLTHSHDSGMELNNGTAAYAVTADVNGNLYAPTGASKIYGTGFNATDHTHDDAHTHNIPSLALNAPSAIYSAGSATGVNVTIDGTSLGTAYASDQSELDITKYILGGGTHTILLSSTALGGLEAQLQAFVLAKSV